VAREACAASGPVTARQAEPIRQRLPARRAAGRTIRLRLPARGRARGAYRVTITARPVGAPPQTVRLKAIRI